MNFRKLLCGAGLGLWCLSALANDDAVTLNLANAEISGVLKFASELTGKMFILDPKVKGNVNVVSAAPMPRSLVYPTLVAALRLQGFAAVDDGKVVRILPEADARQQSVGLGPGDGLSGRDTITTRMFQLKYEAAQAVGAAIKPLLNNAATVVASTANNTLVVTDYAQNLKRLEVVLGAIDVPGMGLPAMVPLSYATATELAPIIQNLMTDGPAQPGAGSGAAAAGGASAGNAVAGDGFAVYAEPHSNSLLIRSSSPGKLLRAQQLIKQVDRPEAGGNIEVIYLKNAVASEVAQMLRAVLSADQSTAKAAGSLSGESNASSALSANRQSGLTSGGNTGGNTSSAAGASGASSSGGGGGWQTAGGLVQGSYVQADVANNAILISAPNIVIERLRKVIRQMDLRRAQVYVEALIAEVSSDTAAQFGFQWQALGGLDKAVDGTRLVGGTSFPAANTGILNMAKTPTGAGAGLSLGVANGTITLPNGDIITNLLALATFLETSNSGNILSTPNLMTLDNQEAQIMIGQDVPIVTGSYSSTASSATVTPFQTFDRRKVGLSLRILPQVSEGGMVRMKIIQEASSVVPSSLSNASGPTINTRTIETAVQVQDGGLIVLGGLLQDSLSDVENKVPGLGDVPLLGGLFRHTSKARTKTNLLVFIRPKTLRSAEADAALSMDRYAYIQGLQKAANEAVKQEAGPLLSPMGLKTSTSLSTVPAQAAPAAEPAAPMTESR
ncbi:type II secretion system secretin GspD [Hydrogenophaga taeniospiralis]|uniref:type II secretion system secretin GspD n=1 Tax=Hydrogenophaga taeniospiralis TaxID=65656 RepID=UPI001CFB732E|nr:type II secretion system secretin GspD [Hydrogenophaga taeniospiralis]MCB4365491.1 type II secretion system secretin GspD [Hydrogenophaga taeniospiralis]